MKAIADSYKLLSICFHYPDASLLDGLKEIEPFRASLKEAALQDLQIEHTRLFSLTVAGGVSPYETEYGEKSIFFKTDRMADIAGFYRGFGMDLTDRVGERCDFIGTELELMYWLVRKEEHARTRHREADAKICRDAQEKFMVEHLGRWAGFFGDTMAHEARHPFYRDVGQWLFSFIESECRRLQVTPERVTGWEPVSISSTEFECGLDDEVSAPQPLTIIK